MQSGAKLFVKSYLNHTFVIIIQLIQTIFISIFSIRCLIEVWFYKIIFQTDAILKNKKSFIPKKNMI